MFRRAFLVHETSRVDLRSEVGDARRRLDGKIGRFVRRGGTSDAGETNQRFLQLRRLVGQSVCVKVVSHQVCVCVCVCIDSHSLGLTSASMLMTFSPSCASTKTFTDWINVELECSQ